MVRLYHYTKKQNIEQIRKTKKLRKSKVHPIGWIHGGSIENGAAFFTKMDPYTNDKDSIARNNWANGWKEKKDEGRADAYIMVEVPETAMQLEFLSDQNPTHNVVAYRGDLNLDKFSWRWGYTDMTIRLLSFNIHYKTNVGKVAEVLNNANADIICLQECKKWHLVNLLSKLKTEYHLFEVENSAAILTRFDKCQPAYKYKFTEHRSFLTIFVPDLGFFVTNVHLDNKKEKTRMEEVKVMLEQFRMESWFPMVLAGDFNSLRRDDYSSEQWETISQKRKEAKPIPWESPKTDVTKLLEEKEGFVDCRSDVLNKSGPIATCRFNTRIDYVYQHQLVKKKWESTSVHHIKTDASDHYPVVVTFKRVL